MKTIYHTYLKIVSAVLLLILLTLYGCVRDDDYIEDINSSSSTIAIKVPGMYLPTVRSMNQVAEEKVKQVDILFFQNGPGGLQLMPVGGGNLYTNGRITSQAGPDITFDIWFSLAAGQYNMLVVANAHDVVQQLQQNGLINPGDSKVSVLEKLVYTNTNKWNVDAANYTPIPMLGEAATVTVSSNGLITGSIPVINMTRMLASIDIDNVASGFTLTDVHLYNYNTVGRIAPKWDAQGNITSIVSTIPNLPAAPLKQPGPFNYIVSQIPFRGEIYTFESDAATDVSESNRINATCLVIGGIYQSQTYYYRVDFCDVNGNYMPLLRNFKYKIQITQASGPGYSSMSEALNSYTVPSNLKVRIITYDLSSMRDVVFNGQYMIALDKSDFTFASNASTQLIQDYKVTIFTDYASGWTLDKITDENGTPISWLITSELEGLGGVLSSLYIGMSGNFGPDRVGYIYLKAGRLGHRIKVTQKAAPSQSATIMSPPGNSIEIPIVQVYRIWDEKLGTPLSGEVTAQLLWQDTQNLISSIHLTDEGANSKITVETNTNSLMGNAVVQVKIGGIVRWSWHLWITDYDPFAGGAIFDYNGRVFMDRNLGAVNDTPGDIGSTGLLYQWGRKDPFPGRSATSGTASEKPLYNIYNQLTYIGLIGQPGSVDGFNDNVPYSIIHPLNFIFASSTSNFDWYRNDNVHNDNLWNNADGSKSIYDPCPAGWRVPNFGSGNTSPWNGLTFSTFTIGHGINWAQAGFYPAAGKRNDIDGNLENSAVGARGYYWSGTPSGASAFNVLFSNENGGSINVNNNGNRASGHSIRCVKE